MNEDKEEQKIIDLRIQFAEETGKYAIKYKYEYTSWLEKKLVKKLSLSGVSKSVVCGNCDGWGYTVDENGRRKDHCKECE